MLKRLTEEQQYQNYKVSIYMRSDCREWDSPAEVAEKTMLLFTQNIIKPQN